MDNPFYKALIHEDAQERIEAVRSMSSVAQELGSDRTVDELLPQLKVLLEDDDEVLLVLADELGQLIDIVGEAKCVALLNLLSGLCQAEEESVRKKATSTLLRISNKFTSDAFSSVFVSFVVKLGEGSWFTSKMSCSALLPTALSRAPPEFRSPLITLYLELTKDKTPMVRRAAATNLKDFIPLIPLDVILSDFVNTFQAIAKDEQDSVRLLAIDVGASLAKSFTENNKLEFITTVVKPVVLVCVQDKSWRVRYQLASSFVNLSNQVPKEIVQELLHVFIKLLKDSEQEVRSAAAENVSGVARLVSQEDVITHLLPCLSALVQDQSQLVRSGFAKDAMVLAPSFGKEGTNTHLLSVILQLLKDDVPEVRLNVISKLDQLTPYVGLEKLSAYLIPAIVALGEDKAWRVRLEVIDDIPPLAAQLQLDFFVSSLGDLCFSWLTDSVYSIRQAAVQNLKKITAVYGDNFTRICVPKVATLCGANTNYLHRITALFYSELVGPSLPPPLVKELILPLVLRLATDPVANIRAAAARVLEVFLGIKEFDFTSQIQPTIEHLIEDKDPDVLEASLLAKKKL